MNINIVRSDSASQPKSGELSGDTSHKRKCPTAGGVMLNPRRKFLKKAATQETSEIVVK